MKIAIEAQRIFRPDKHGMDFVILEVLRELQKRDDGHQYDVYVAPGPDRCLQTEGNLRVIELRCPTYPLWEQVALPCAVKHSDACLLHCTSNTAPLYSPVPLMVTLHDIIYLEPRSHRSPSLYQEMGWHYRRLVVPRIVKKCRCIITVSQYEQQRICQTLPVPPRMVVPVYNGYNPHFKPAFSNDKRQYIFFLGNTDPKKNTVRTLQAYALYLQKSMQRRPLLIADLKEDYVDALLKQYHLTEIKPYLHTPGYIPNTELPTVYQASFAFLYPSLRESFGIPILEAMACGTPVITSRTSAMPEVAGAGGLLVDPCQPQEIARALLRLETDEPFRQQQIAYGLERVKQFSWKNTAKHYIQLYESIFQTTPY